MKLRQISIAMSPEAYEAINSIFVAKGWTAASALRSGLELLAQREKFKLPEFTTRAYQRGGKPRQAKLSVDIDMNDLLKLRSHSAATGKTIADIVRKSLAAELPGSPKKVA